VILRQQRAKDRLHQRAQPQHRAGQAEQIGYRDQVELGLGGGG
jgi:hypothetical protein